MKSESFFVDRVRGGLALALSLLTVVALTTRVLGEAPPSNHVITVSMCPPDLNWNSSTPTTVNITTIGNFVLDDGSGPAVQPTTVRLCYDNNYLHVR